MLNMKILRLTFIKVVKRENITASALIRVPLQHTHKVKKLTSYIISSRHFRIIAPIILAIILLIAILPRLGTWLIVEEDMQPADAMIILMGSTADRALAAYNVYEGNYTENIIIVESNQRGIEHIEALDVHVPNNAEIIKYVLTQLTIPSENILILPGNAQSTKQEAKIISTHLEQNSQINSIILVTSASHMRRSVMTFRREFRKLDHEVEIIPSPSKYSDFQARGWYKDRESAKAVVMEYMKLVAWFVGL